MSDNGASLRLNQRRREDAMSWMPAQDPVLGDKRSCDALNLIIVPRVRDLGGGFSVHRALPHANRQMVGPFIFFDQMGPVQLIAGQGDTLSALSPSFGRQSPILRKTALFVRDACAALSRNRKLFFSIFRPVWRGGHSRLSS
jgi:hypothetical protein